MKFFARLLLLAASLLSIGAFPLAPDHTLYGQVRDQYGTPLFAARASVLFVSAEGKRYSVPLIPALAPGMNYKMPVPMDSGSAIGEAPQFGVVAQTQFKMYVIVGTVTNTPIESATFASLGFPAQQSRLDLTLGTDANNNGLPDAWEYAFISSLGVNLDFNTLDPNRVYSPSGRTLEQEFLLGNYPFDPQETFDLRFVNLAGDAPVLEFSAMIGRTYTLLGSSDLRQWQPMTFNILDEGPNAQARTFYLGQDIRVLRFRANQPPSGPVIRFFQVLLQ